MKTLADQFGSVGLVQLYLLCVVVSAQGQPLTNTPLEHFKNSGIPTYKNEPRQGICGEDHLLYRYFATRVDETVVEKENCVGDPKWAKILLQPQHLARGVCPTEACGASTSWPSAPIEPALLAAAVEAAKIKTVKVGSARKVHDAEDLSNRIRFGEQTLLETVKFDLAKDVHCISKTQMYENDFAVNVTADLATPNMSQTSKNTFAKALKTHHLERAELFIEQTQTHNGYALLMRYQSATETYSEGQFLRLKTLCLSKEKPINFKDISAFSFLLNVIKPGIYRVAALPKSASMREGNSINGSHQE